MSHSEPLSQWIEMVSTAFPMLSQPQAKALALWSYGIVLAKACGITLVYAALALQLGYSETRSGTTFVGIALRRSQQKKGKKRRELDVSTCFGSLLRWILCWRPADEPHLALALGRPAYI